MQSMCIEQYTNLGVLSEVASLCAVSLHTSTE